MDSLEDEYGDEKPIKEGMVLALAKVHTYEACSNRGCFNKKLVHSKCPYCNTRYESDTKNGITATFLIQSSEEVEEYVAFRPVLIDLYHLLSNGNNPLAKTEDDITQQIASLLPCKIRYTISGKNILSSISMSK